jgi:hypothetical protein
VLNRWYYPGSCSGSRCPSQGTDPMWAEYPHFTPLICDCRPGSYGDSRLEMGLHCYRLGYLSRSCLPAVTKPDDKRVKIMGFHATSNGTLRRELASAAEVSACFRDERDLLLRLAWLITGDGATAEQVLADAQELALNGPAPFRDWLLGWAKWATIKAAILNNHEAICSCEASYEDIRCDHREHLIESGETQSKESSSLLLRIDPIIVSELDPMARAVLVLRTAAKSSLSNCALQLNVSASAVLGANCRAMTWLRDAQTTTITVEESATSRKPACAEQRRVGGI